VLDAAATAAAPLWEAFVFPFHEQIERVREAIVAGAIGDVREISSRFHFTLNDPHDIRLSGELGGGSIQDVGCYPIRLARMLFGAEPDPDGTIADAVWTASGVDTELWGALVFPGERRLLFSCGFVGAYDTDTRVLGTEGEIHMTNPFHPRPGDTYAIVRGDAVEEYPAAQASEHSFTAAVAHIHRALRGEEPPRHLAVDDAMGNAVAIVSSLLAAGGRS
jgi:predicted dehydrogenase